MNGDRRSRRAFLKGLKSRHNDHQEERRDKVSQEIHYFISSVA